MKLDPSNPFESQLWRDVFLSWLKERGGPAYTESGNEKARIVAGRQADLAVEIMRERMPAPEQIPTHLTETAESFRQTSESEGRSRERADVLDFMRHPPGSVTDSQRRFLGELVKAIERGTHAGCASRLYAEQAPAAALTESRAAFDGLLGCQQARERAAMLDLEQATARVTAERLHVAPGWVSSAAGIRKAIDGAADRGDVIVVDIRVDDENVAQWVLSVPEQAEALVAALLSVGVEP